MKPIEIHVEGYKIVISKDDEQPDIPKDKQDKKTTMPSYPNYPVVPPIINPYVTWTGGELTVTNCDEYGNKMQNPCARQDGLEGDR